VRRVVVTMTASLVVTMLAVPVASAQGQPGDGIEVSAFGVGKPPPGAGMGTQAALDNPKCDASTVKGWGTFPLVTTTFGPYCVAPAPKDNGGATSRGVTGKTIKVVVILGAGEPGSSGVAGVSPDETGATNRATGQPTSIRGALLDAWTALSHGYETWGRDVKFVFITSSGLGEAEQRADAVKIAAEKPMFVINNNPLGLGTLAATLAQKRFVVFSESTTPKEAATLAPYLWGLSDADASTTNAAAFVGRQLAGRDAQNAGDKSMHHQPRKFGLVYPNDTDPALFTRAFQHYKGKLATPPLAYTGSGTPLGDAATADEQAPTIITKLKDAGVTSVILLSDIAMTGSLTRAATKQEFRPEWVVTGARYQDSLARGYDQEQWAHAFGISTLGPPIKSGNPQDPNELLDWYWGPNRGSVSVSTSFVLTWLANAIQYAGPTLTPKNVQLGLFAVPARGGAAWNDPTTSQQGYGLTAGLPQPSYLQTGFDFAPFWYDANASGVDPLLREGKGVNRYLDGGRRYVPGSWPTKPLPFFKTSGTVLELTANPKFAGTPVPCNGCPSNGGPGTPSTG
jgi:hypothetical protein